MDQLRSFTLANLYQKVFLDEDAFILWLQELGLLHRRRTCDCGGNMTQRNAKSGRDHGHWRCTVRACNKEKGPCEL